MAGIPAKLYLYGGRYVLFFLTLVFLGLMSVFLLVVARSCKGERFIFCF
jgi:hypothetical protein